MWRIAADTGGTFTDCYAVAPDGTEHRCKVLSSGCLRARIERITQCIARASDETHDSRVSQRAPAVKVSVPWDTPDEFFTGFRAALVGTDEPHVEVAGWDRERAMLRFASELPPSWQPGALVELTSGEEAPVLGARLLTHTPPGSPFPPLRFRLATTRATNALLERKGSRVAFFVTNGFADLLAIGDQRRVDLFALRHEARPVFHEAAVEITGRMNARGDVLTPLDEASLRAAAEASVKEGIRHAAVALLHSYANPAHERRAAAILREAGFEHVTVSSEIAAFTKILPRAQSAVANAYLTAPVEAFLDDVAAPLHPSSGDGASSFHVMTSAGGLTSRPEVKPKDLLLSGPAGGVIGAANAAREMGFTRIITFDMGGTSTDVARIDERPGYRFSQQIAGMSLLAPCVAIETVAAGGGSICQWTPCGLAVGPASAGSNPGPACYGKGGPLTITDVNLLLGRFDPARAPIPLDVAAARSRLEELRAQIKATRGGEIEVEDLLRGFLQLAIERMADAIRRISVAEGYDPADHALLAFGGAGPQHACALAARLGIGTVLVPRHAGILSAVGLHQALPECFAERQMLLPLAEALPALPRTIHALAREARASLERQNVSRCDPPHALAELRLRGQDSPLQLTITQPERLQDDYRAAYQRLFGYTPPEGRVIELVSLRVSVRASVINGTRQSSDPQVEPRLAPPESCAESVTIGPAVIQDAFSTLVIDSGWRATKSGDFGWILTRQPRVSGHAPPTRSPDHGAPLAHDLYRHRFHAIVEEMGALLCRTAISTNIRERLDFSCALLDPEGRLVTSAPHIPVHLGALGVCVRESTGRRGEGEEVGEWPSPSLRPRLPAVQPGDTIITNHPAFGGSHLPDITLITPVYDSRDTLIGFVANRAHHAEIGGITPGSMPANAERLVEEGTVIAPRHLIRGGKSCFDEIENLFTTGPHPTRNLADNLADLHAQLAANLLGVQRLRALDKDSRTVRAMMRAILEDSARVMREQITRITECEAEERLDDGSVIRVKISAVPDSPSPFRIDFTGTSPTHAGNLNATTAIVQSAVLYVLRLLLQQDLPLNEGLMDPVQIILPPSMLNPVFTGDAARDPAVVGGNVEVSQRLVDTLIKALQFQACSQGTMNNFLFGDSRFGYYETIAGGSGAGIGYDGASALHTHMTNTAITDPEIIEQRHPVLLRKFAIRRGSGGGGKWRGGDGVVREFEFLAPLIVSLLTQHRTSGPFGIDGGTDGARGKQTLVAADGHTTDLPPSCSIDVRAGERLCLETPGGGGAGRP